MSEEKTEEPTEAKKRESRRKGQVVKSQDLVSAVTLAAGLAIMLSLLPTIHDLTFSMLSNNLAILGAHSDPWQMLRGTIRGVIGLLVVALLPTMMGSAAAGTFVNLVGTGGAVTSHVLKPDPNRLNPLNTLKRWFSKRTLQEAAKIAAKFGAMIWVVWDYCQHQARAFINVSGVTIHHFSERFDGVIDLCWKLVGVQFLFGIVDFGIQYYDHKQQLKMTKQEVKDEYKKQEGDPMIKARRRARARKMLMSSGIGQLGEASVVVTNPTHLSVAIKYNAQMSAPVIVAKGADQIAFEIRKRAKELDIPLSENVKLARALYPLDLGRQIPLELFQAVAELLLSVKDAEEYLS